MTLVARAEQSDGAARLVFDPSFRLSTGLLELRLSRSAALLDIRCVLIVLLAHNRNARSGKRRSAKLIDASSPGGIGTCGY
jgi:hypothetical protein